MTWAWRWLVVAAVDGKARRRAHQTFVHETEADALETATAQPDLVYVIKAKVKVE